MHLPAGRCGLRGHHRKLQEGFRAQESRTLAINLTNSTRKKLFPVEMGRFLQKMHFSWLTCNLRCPICESDGIIAYVNVLSGGLSLRQCFHNPPCYANIGDRILYTTTAGGKNCHGHFDHLPSSSGVYIISGPMGGGV